MSGKKAIIWIIAIVAVIAILAVFMNLGSDGNYDEFAKCTSIAGAKMYGAFWCSHCAAQKKVFGDSWEYVNYIECSTPDGNSQNDVCRVAGIQGYPTWEFADGSRVSSEMTLQQIADITGCPLN